MSNETSGGTCYPFLFSFSSLAIYRLAQKRMTKWKMHIKLRMQASDILKKSREAAAQRARVEEHERMRREQRAKTINMLPPLEKLPIYPRSAENSPRMVPYTGERRRQEEKVKEASKKPKFWLPAPAKTKVVDPGFSMRAAAAAKLSLPQTPFQYVGKSARLKPKHYYFAEWMLPAPPCHPLHLKEVERIGISYHERIQRDGARKRAMDEQAGLTPRRPEGSQRKDRGGRGSKIQGRTKGKTTKQSVRRGREVMRVDQEEVRCEEVVVVERGRKDDDDDDELISRPCP